MGVFPHELRCADLFLVFLVEVRKPYIRDYEYIYITKHTLIFTHDSTTLAGSLVSQPTDS